MLIHWEVVQFKLAFSIDGQSAGKKLFIIIMLLRSWSCPVLLYISLYRAECFYDYICKTKVQTQLCSKLTDYTVAKNVSSISDSNRCSDLSELNLIR